MANQKIKTADKNMLNPVDQKLEKQHRFIVFGILALTGLVFANSLGNGFIENFDDSTYVIDNELIRHINWNSLKEMFSSSFLGYYHPLTLLSYAIEYKFFGTNPFVFHFTNYIFHILNTLLVYLFIKRFTGKFWVAIITALFFGIHPMHVESVAWIAERKDMLYTFFFLLSLISYVKYIEFEKKKSYLIWTYVWFFLSLLSKPAAVCLPLMLVLIDSYKNKKILWQTVITKIPFFLLSMLFGIFAIISVHSVNGIQNFAPVFSLLDRVFLVSYSITFYLFKILIPFNLYALHYYPIKTNGMLPMEYYLTLPALMALIWLMFKSGRFKHELIFGLLFYLATIILELQVIPTGQAIVSERYSYVPSIGVFFIVGQFFTCIYNNEFPFNKKIKEFLPYFIVILTLLCFFLTYQRNKVWENGEILFRDVINKSPQQGYSWYALGISEYRKNNIDTAIVDYTKAIELDPKFPLTYLNRANSEVIKKDFDAAMIDYSKAIEVDPHPAPAYFNRGNIECTRKNFNSAMIDYSTAIEIDPTIAEPYFGRGTIENVKGNFNAAIEDFTKAIKLKPNFANAYFNRGISEFCLNNKQNACQDWALAEQYGNLNAVDALNQYCK